MKPSVSRRRFLRRAFAATTVVALAPSPLTVFAARANERFNLALIGVGGRGEWFVGAMPGMGTRFAALCDVHEYRTRQWPARRPIPTGLLAKVPPERWNDYRLETKGGGVTITINGSTVAELDDRDPRSLVRGWLRLQVHTASRRRSSSSMLADEVARARVSAPYQGSVRGPSFPRGLHTAKAPLA